MLSDYANGYDSSNNLYEGCRHESVWSLKEVDEVYINQLSKHIVGFKIRITQWEAAWKLHQDYKYETQIGVINALQNCQDDNSKEIANLMKKNLLS